MWNESKKYPLVVVSWKEFWRMKCMKGLHWLDKVEQLSFWMSNKKKWMNEWIMDYIFVLPHPLANFLIHFSLCSTVRHLIVYYLHFIQYHRLSTWIVIIHGHLSLHIIYNLNFVCQNFNEKKQINPHVNSIYLTFIRQF